MAESFVDAALNHAADKDIYNQVSHLVDREKFKGVYVPTAQKAFLNS